MTIGEFGPGMFKDEIISQFISDVFFLKSNLMIDGKTETWLFQRNPDALEIPRHWRKNGR